MKKNIKKLTSMMLALVMAFALAAPAFAAPADANTATIKFVWKEGEEETEIYPDIVYTLPSTGTVTIYDVIQTHSSELEPAWSDVPNVNPNVPGTTAKALDSLLDVANEAGNGATSGIQALAWSSEYPSYGLISYNVEGDVTTCNYVYWGASWEYSVNGTVIENLYMDQYTLSAGDVVVLEYAERATYWTADSSGVGGGLLSNAYPYLP